MQPQNNWYIEQQIENIKGGNEEKQREAAKGLIELQDIGIITPLLNLLGTGNSNVSKFSGYILANMGNIGQLAILEALTNNNSNVRLAATKAVVYILRSKDNTISINDIGESLVNNLKDENPRIRASAAVAFCAMKHTQSVEVLIELLDDSNPNVVFNAVRALGFQDDERALQPLLRMLAIKTPLRTAIISSLAEFSNPLIADSLINIAVDTTDDIRVREIAVYTLGEIKDKRALTHLINILKDNSDSLKAEVILALSKFQESELFEIFVEALNDKDNLVRKNAAYALFKSNSSKALIPLTNALNDVYVSVRYYAVLGLGKYGNKDVIEVLESIRTNDKAHTGEEDEGTMKQAAEFAINRIMQRM